MPRKLFLAPKAFGLKEILAQKTLLVWKKIWSSKEFGQKKCWLKRNWFKKKSGSKKNWSRKKKNTNTNRDPKKFGVWIKLSVLNFLVQKENLSPIIFWVGRKIKFLVLDTPSYKITGPARSTTLRKNLPLVKNITNRNPYDLTAARYSELRAHKTHTLLFLSNPAPCKVNVVKVALKSIKNKDYS